MRMPLVAHSASMFFLSKLRLLAAVTLASLWSPGPSVEPPISYWPCLVCVHRRLRLSRGAESTQWRPLRRYRDNSQDDVRFLGSRRAHKAAAPVHCAHRLQGKKCVHQGRLSGADEG